MVLVNKVLPRAPAHQGELQAMLRAAELEQAGTVAIRVMKPRPGAAASNSVTWQLANPAPVVQSISPAQSPAGADSLVVRVTGSGFVPATVVRFRGARGPRAT